MTIPSMGGAGLHLHFDPMGGAAGDMFVAALLDARPDLTARVMADVAAVLPDAAGRAELTSLVRSGIAGRGFALVPGDAPPRKGAETTYVAMRDLIGAAPLAEGTARHAQAILHALAQAEAEIHAKPIERVHFHEIADWDALMDVVAAGSLCAALEGASFSLSPLPLGSGQIETSHGRLSVPAPATLRLLKGFEWHDDGISGERVTPTGAAILAHLMGGREQARHPSGRLLAIGYGAGTRTLPGVANVLRVTVTAVNKAALGDADQVLVLACDVDDMTGEEIAHAAQHLRAVAGVLDVSLLALTGKKGRPATRFELLVAPEQAGAAEWALFTQTSTLGVRRVEMTRTVLRRGHTEGPDGRPAKWARRPDGTLTGKVESDALADLPTLAERRRAAHWAPADDGNAED